MKRYLLKKKHVLGVTKKNKVKKKNETTTTKNAMWF